MRKLLYTLVLLGFAVYCGLPVTPVAAAPQQSTIAVILLGSPEYLRPDYYDISTESLLKRFPADTHRLIIGDYPQQMFDRFSDKLGLAPGEIPTEEKLSEFAWVHSFNRVLFILLTAPTVKSNQLTIQIENPEVTITARALLFDSRTRKKLADASSTQTVKTLGRGTAKRATFQKCMEALRSQL